MSYDRKKEMRSYEALCRGEARPQKPWELRKMKCWYNRKGPYLILKPARVERVWAYPEAFMLRGVLEEKTIQNIKTAATPILKRATIQDPITGKLRTADYRVAKTAWLDKSYYPFVGTLATYISAVVNLNMSYAEQLQISNYGMAGQYEPHFDHAREEEDKFTDLGMGNRIATVLFYLSDVEAGGATAFVAGETAVFPSKGDALFWYNLKRNGKGNPMTRHAACPVLAGVKWVSNWWIHEAGQEFNHRCSNNPNF